MLAVNYDAVATALTYFAVLVVFAFVVGVIVSAVMSGSKEPPTPQSEMWKGGRK